MHGGDDRIHSVAFVPGHSCQELESPENSLGTIKIALSFSDSPNH